MYIRNGSNGLVNIKDFDEFLENCGEQNIFKTLVS